VKKLEEIPKTNIFEVPEGYFERLPGIIQSRVGRGKPAFTWHISLAHSWRFAFPVIILLGVGLFWYQGRLTASQASVEFQLRSIDSGQLGVYLNDHDLSTDELVEAVTWSKEDIHDLESSVYSTLGASHEELETILDNYDVNL
jgi:hypothetical protein